ncbi:MAG: hypothetical protein AAF525_01585 [Pseudomonadota bacterium]
MSKRHPCVLLLVMCLSPGALAADRQVAQTWLAQSEKIALEESPDGFANAQLNLSHAYGHAALGRSNAVRHSVESIFGDDRRRAGWRSGGDGAVRELLIVHEQLKLSDMLLLNLIPTHTGEAVRYIQWLEGYFESPFPELWLRVGELGGQVTKQQDVSGSARVAVDFGLVIHALNEGNPRVARRQYRTLTPDERREILNGSLLTKMMLSGDDEALFRLLYLTKDDLDAPMLQQAVMLSRSLSHEGRGAEGRSLYGTGTSAVQADDRMQTLLERLGTLSPAIADQTSQMLAQAYLLNDDIEKARHLFNRQTKPGAAWETVALGIGDIPWLEKYYLSITNPWRRTERLTQLALRLLPESPEDSDRIIAHARSGLDQVPGHSQSAAIGIMLRYFGRSGNRPLAETFLTRLRSLNPDANTLMRAQQSVAMANAVAGDADGLRVALRALPDDWSRVRTLVAIAGADTSISEPLTDATAILLRRTTGADSVQKQHQRQQEQAWSDIVTAQLNESDDRGAVKTIGKALDRNEGVIALETYVKERTSGRPRGDDITTLWSLVQRLPGQFDGRVGYDRKARLESDLVKWLAQHDDVDMARRYLPKVSHDQVRMLAMPVVADAMVRSMVQSMARDGSAIKDDQLAAVQALIKSSSRSDSRVNAMMPILHRFAAVRQQIPASFLSLLPDRHQRFCWSAAAVVDMSAVEVKNIDTWHAQIEDPLCRAHAQAGSAFAASDPAMDPGEIVALVDPARTSERMAEAMVRQSSRMR